VLALFGAGALTAGELGAGWFGAEVLALFGAGALTAGELGAGWFGDGALGAG